MTAPDLAERIDALLPQTQCGQCGYQGCRPYAHAVAAGAADLNRCPPGGDVVIADLARVLGRTAKPLDPTCGVTKPPAVAVIDEAWCIGCTLCIQACPVDAIVGAAKLMHTVIAQQCTGCELCIPPCPVDCIVMAPVALNDEFGERSAQLARAARARARYLTRQARLARLAAQPRQARAAQGRAPYDDAAKKHAAIARALTRARTRLQNNK